MSLAVALTYSIIVLMASSSGCHATVSLADLAPTKNLISLPLSGQLLYILFLCAIHLVELNRKCCGDSRAVPDWHVGESTASAENAAAAILPC